MLSCCSLSPRLESLAVHLWKYRFSSARATESCNSWTSAPGAMPFYPLYTPTSLTMRNTAERLQNDWSNAVENVLSESPFRAFCKSICTCSPHLAHSLLLHALYSLKFCHCCNSCCPKLHPIASASLFSTNLDIYEETCSKDSKSRNISHLSWSSFYRNISQKHFSIFENLDSDVTSTNRQWCKKNTKNCVRQSGICVLWKTPFRRSYAPYISELLLCTCLLVDLANLAN